MLHSLFLSLLFGTIQPIVAPVITDIYIGDHGPYRFLVDTGSQSTMIDPKLAGELNLRPQFRIEIVTLHGSHLVPGMNVNTLRLAQQTLPPAELLFQDVTEAQRLAPSIRGVLGANVLSHFDFLLSPKEGRLEVASSRPAGEALPFTTIDGRMVVNAQMGNESLALVLDSGASHIVLFRTPAAMSRTKSIAGMVNTLEGARSVATTTWTADLVFSGQLRIGTLPAAVVQQPHKDLDGLLPTSLFQKVYVDQAHHEVVLVR